MGKREGGRVEKGEKGGGGGGVDGEEGGWRRGKREGGGVSACGDLDLFGVLGVWEVFRS